MRRGFKRGFLAAVVGLIFFEGAGSVFSGDPVGHFAGYGQYTLNDWIAIGQIVAIAFLGGFVSGLLNGSFKLLILGLALIPLLIPVIVVIGLLRVDLLIGAAALNIILPLAIALVALLPTLIVYAYQSASRSKPKDSS